MKWWHWLLLGFGGLLAYNWYRMHYVKPSAGSGTDARPNNTVA